VLVFCDLVANPTIPAPIFQEVDTTPAAVENLIAAPPELSPIVQILVARVQAPAAVQVPAAVPPAVDLPL
jgi:hypothetical protein